MTQLQVTPASQWKKQTILAELPSGRVAELQRVSAIQLVMDDGSIPDDLYGYMLQAADGSLNEAQVKDDPQALKAFFMMQNQVAKAAFVNPRVVDTEPNYEHGEVAITDIDDVDISFVAHWAMQGGDEKAALKRFRDQQTRTVATAPQKQDLPSKSKRRTRN